MCAASWLGCRSSPLPPTPDAPPPQVLTVSESRIALRATASLELFAWLTRDDPVPDYLGPARAALHADAAAGELRRAFERLAGCAEPRCVVIATAPVGDGGAFSRALASFVARDWKRRADVAFVAFEATHAALLAEGEASASADALVERAAQELGMPWPDAPTVVDVVAAAPKLPKLPHERDEESDAQLVPLALAASGPCFLEGGRPQPGDRVRDARILDCMLVHATLGVRQPGPLAVELARTLGPREGRRAFELLVVHAVAALVTGWERRHVSVYRRAAMRTEGRMLDWLTQEWRGLLHQDAADVARRYALAWRDAHSTADR